MALRSRYYCVYVLYYVMRAYIHILICYIYNILFQENLFLPSMKYVMHNIFGPLQISELTYLIAENNCLYIYFHSIDAIFLKLSTLKVGYLNFKTCSRLITRCISFRVNWFHDYVILTLHPTSVYSL